MAVLESKVHAAAEELVRTFLKDLVLAQCLKCGYGRCLGTMPVAICIRDQELGAICWTIGMDRLLPGMDLRYVQRGVWWELDIAREAKAKAG